MEESARITLCLNKQQFCFGVFWGRGIAVHIGIFSIEIIEKQYASNKLFEYVVC